MKKIPTLFKRNPERMSEILREPNPDCQWVFDGEGIATRKYDGTCCRVKDGELWKRREFKKIRPQPERFELADYDEATGKSVGWVPVEPTDRWHIEAFGNGEWAVDGTYELCGPKVQGNPEGFAFHVLIAHAAATRFYNVPRTFDGLRDFLGETDIEGIVFHHPDGRMAKIKKRDFGLRRV